MALVQVRQFSDDDEAVVVALWQTCGLLRSWNDPHLDIARKRGQGDEFFLVAVIDSSVVGAVMAGYDGHRGWVNYLAVDPTCQRRGIAQLLMREVEQRLTDSGCPKLNLQVRVGNDEARRFYEAIGYAEDEVVSYSKRLINDSPSTP